MGNINFMWHEETLDELLGERGRQLTADAAGIGRTSIWRWRTGNASPCKAQATALAAAFGVEVERVLAAAAASRRRAVFQAT